VILVGYEELHRFFPRHRGIWVPVPAQFSAFSRKVHRLFKRMAKRGFLGRVDSFEQRKALMRSTGILPGSLVMDELGQVEGMVSSSWIAQLVKGHRSFPALPERKPGGLPLCFVHVRRTDYSTWPRPDIPAILPAAWFARAMDFITESIGPVDFVVVTDDREWVRQDSVLGPIDLFEGSELEDWALMASCDAGILSPSSFAYWAAKIATDLNRVTGPFVAPTYWGAWMAKEWYPTGMNSSFFSFLEVE